MGRPVLGGARTCASPRERSIGLRRLAGVATAIVATGMAACGGIADMTDAGASATFTVETPSLGSETFEVEEEQVRCLGRNLWTEGEPGDPIDTLHVSLQTGVDVEDPRVFFELSPYEESGRIRVDGTCDPGFCCGPGPCGTITAIGPGFAGQYGGDSCWVDVAYSSGWARGTFDCTFWPQTTREPGTRVHGSFRCPIEE